MRVFVLRSAEGLLSACLDHAVDEASERRDRGAVECHVRKVRQAAGRNTDDREQAGCSREGRIAGKHGPYPRLPPVGCVHLFAPYPMMTTGSAQAARTAISDRRRPRRQPRGGRCRRRSGATSTRSPSARCSRQNQDTPRRVVKPKEAASAQVSQRCADLVLTRSGAGVAS